MCNDVVHGVRCDVQPNVYNTMFMRDLFSDLRKLSKKCITYYRLSGFSEERIASPNWSYRDGRVKLSVKLTRELD